MSNIIKLEDRQEQNFAVEIERTEEFYETAKDMSEYLNSLPLSHEQSDILIGLILKHVNSAEVSGFKFGVKLSKDIWQAKESMGKC